MNILYICDEYPPGMNGGIGTAVQVLSRELVNQGHKVTVIGLYPYYYGQKDYEIDQGVEVIRMRYGINKGSNKHLINKIEAKLPRFLKSKINRKQAFKKFVNRINTIIKEESIDIIEIADWNTFAYDMGFKVEWPSFPVPLVVKLHGSYSYLVDQLDYPNNKRNYEIDKHLITKRADAITSVSQYTATITQRIFHLTQPITTLYNGIEVNSLKKQKREDNLVIFTGSLVSTKGVFSLMKAWNIVRKQILTAQLEMYGKGKTQSLIDLLDKEAISSVIFHGHTSRGQLFNQLSKATLAVFPSYAETFGLTAVEAMSVGCPTIFTERTTGPEIIDNKVDGVLVDPDNYNEIAEEIINILSSKELQEKYSIGGRKKVEEKFNIQKSAREHIVFYQKTINVL